MNTYAITSKILKFFTQISEELTKLQLTNATKISPMLRKKNCIKALAWTLGNENVPLKIPNKGICSCKNS